MNDQRSPNDRRRFARCLLDLFATSTVVVSAALGGLAVASDNERLTIMVAIISWNSAVVVAATVLAIVKPQALTGEGERPEGLQRRQNA